MVRARAWAERAFGAGAVRVVADSSFAAALADGPAQAGAVLVIAAELPVWHPELATAVLDDLRAGCALALAPIFEGGLYLLALADPSADRAAALAALDLTAPVGFAQLFSLAQRERWEVGLHRAERGLRRARDVRALLADPLTDPELRTLLG